MRLAARLLLIVLFAVSCFLFSVPSAHAQMNPYLTPNTDANVPADLHTYTQSLTMEVLSSVVCLLDGQDILHPGTPCLGVDPKTQKLGYAPKNNGLVGFAIDMTAALYTPPVQMGQYVSYVSQHFGLVKKTYADSGCQTQNVGVGLCSISPLIGIWTGFRNIVYLFFVVIFILVGFGIMLRYKIDPRTVMSIENQIPKLVIALVMVTFSFAIAGILIDTMWVSSFAVVDILTGVDSANPIAQQSVNNNFFENPLGFSNNVLPGGVLGVSFGSAGSIKDVLTGLLSPSNIDQLGLTPKTSVDCENDQGLIGWIGTAFCNFGQGPGNVIGNVVAGALGYLISYTVGILAVIVFLVAILWSMFRVWFTLLGAYVGILIDIILGPFKIALGVLPGSKTNYMSWIKDLLANLLAFPTAIAMFLLARLLMDAFTTNGGVFVPPLIGNPLGTAGNGNPIGFLVGTGMLLLTPKAVDFSRGFLKVEPGKNSQQIFQAIGKGTAAVGKVAGGAMNAKFGNRMYWDAKNNKYATAGTFRSIAMGFGLVK